MGYYDALIAKWPSLTSTTTDAKLAEINALTVAGPRNPVPISAVMDYLRTNNLWLPIKVSAGKFASGDTTASVGAAAAVDLNDDMRMQNINFDLQIVQEMLADLVSHNLLSQVQSDALGAMGNTTQLWTQANKYPSISYGDLAMASLEGLTPWSHGAFIVEGPDANGNTRVSADFWDTATPAQTYRFGPYSTFRLDNAAADAWAQKVMVVQAERAALAKQIV